MGLWLSVLRGGGGSLKYALALLRAHTLEKSAPDFEIQAYIAYLISG